MIGRLSGRLLEKLPPHLLLDVQGVGYEVDAPMTTFYQLPAVGETVTLHIHQVVREDALLLYGFASRAERETFRQLLKVSGIGAKIALAILSSLSADELALAVAGENVARLSKVPGIGKKTAERLILELRGKLGVAASDSPAALPMQAGNDASADITHALLALGYNDKEASAAVKTLPAGTKLEDGIRLALKALVKA